MAQSDHRVDDAGSGSVDIDATVETLLAAAALPEELAPRLEEQEPADAADSLEQLTPDAQAETVHLMKDAAAAEALSHMELPLAASVLDDLEEDEAARLLALMEPDDAADVLQAVDAERRAALVKRMPPRRAAIVGKLVLYEPDSAGGVMTTSIAVVRASMRIGQAIDSLKRHSFDEQQTDIYCVDDEKRLAGVIGLRDLLVIDDAELVSAHMDLDFDAVGPDADREDVARMFERYDLRSLPVVDEVERVLGIVTIDDVIDILDAEATEDAYKQVGAGEGEAVYSRVWDKLRGRTPWLLGNLFMAQVGSVVLLAYADLIELIPVVAVVYPIIANQSGNSGHQSMAITLRGIVLGEVRRERVGPLVRNELLFGLSAGAAIGAVFALGVALVGPALPGAIGAGVSWWWFAACSGLAMAGAMAVSCLVGTGMPMAMQRLGADPATASSIFVTMLTDAISYAAFLTVVLAMRGLVVPPAG